MIEVFRFIWSITTRRQRFLLFVTICSPLILSGFLHLISFQFGLAFLDVRTKDYLLVMWLISFTVFFVLFLIFSFHCTRHEDFNGNRTKIANSIINLLENRLKYRNGFTYFLCFTIFTFYYLTLIPLIVEYYKGDVFSSLYMVIAPLFLLLLFTNLLRVVFLGFREKAINRYFSFISTFSVYIIFYWLNLTDKLQITLEGSGILPSLKENANWIIPVIISTIIAIILVIAEERLKKKYPKRKIKRWERSQRIFDVFAEFILAYILLSFLFLLNLFLGVISINNVPESQKLMLIIIAFFIGAILLLSFFFIKHFSESFVENMISWNEFFQCYHGQTIKELGEYPQQLIKVSGKCKAISINEKYRKKHENFNQHFLLEIDGCEKKIDVISLEEKTPFKNYLPLVSESDEITLIGEMKLVLNDETFSPNNNRISKLIIAHHIEPKNKS